MLTNIKKWIRNIIITLGFSSVILGASTVPVVDKVVECSVAASEISFNTDDGYLHKGQYAYADGGTEFVWVGGFNKVITKETDLSGLEQRLEAGFRYWRKCNIDGQLEKDYITQEIYEGYGLKNVKMERTIKESLLSSMINEADAAIAAGDTSGGTALGTDSLTFAHDVSGSDTIIIVGTASLDSNDANRPITGVTYNSDALIEIDQIDQGGGTSEAVGQFYRLAPDAGTHNVVITATGSLNGLMGGAITLTGAAQQEYEAKTTGNGNSDSPSISVTTITDNAWVVDALGCEANVSSEGAGQTIIYQEEPETYRTGAGSYEGPKTPAGGVTMSWSINYGSRWNMIGTAWEVAGAEPPAHHDVPKIWQLIMVE